MASAPEENVIAIKEKTFVPVSPYPKMPTHSILTIRRTSGGSIFSKTDVGLACNGASGTFHHGLFERMLESDSVHCLGTEHSTTTRCCR
jgi:hypothetical protein